MSNLDLIFPTYNRPDFLRRILDYYNYYKVDFNLIIADSSSQRNKKINKEIISSYSKLKIQYIDKFSDKMISHHKFAEMVEYAKSKYSVICADDDFIIPTGIEEAIYFLEKNPEYSCAHGTYISFYVPTLNKKKLLWQFIYPYKSIEYSKAERRFMDHLTNYYQVLYSVRRTDKIKLAYREFMKFKIDPILFGELLPDMLMLIYGKMKRLDNFYMARQAFSTLGSTWPSLIDAVKNGTFDKEYAKFKDCLISNIMQNSDISKKNTEELIDKSMKIYLKSTKQEYLMGKINKILKSLPTYFTKIVRFLHTSYLFSKTTKDKIGLIDNPSSKYFNDFDNLKKIILAH